MTDLDARFGNDADDAKVLHPSDGDSYERLPLQTHLAQEWFNALAIRAIQKDVTKATLDSYRRNLRVWLRYLDGEGNDQPDTATVRGLLDFLKGGKAATVNAILDAVRVFYAWAAMSGRYSDIARAVHWISFTPSPLEDLPDDAFDRLLAVLPEEGVRPLRDRALLMLIYDCGIETISAHRADVGDIELREGTFIHQPKGHRIRDVVARLSPQTCAAFADYLAARGAVLASDPLFVRFDHLNRAGDRLSTLSMRLTVLRIMEKVGIAKRDEHGNLEKPGVFSSSSLRRSARKNSAAAHAVTPLQGP